MEYLRSSSELLAWLLTRAFAQVATILLMANHLGPDGYGSFVTAIAISSLFIPLAGLGLHAIILREGARNPGNLPKLLGATLSFWWPSTLTLSFIATILTTSLLSPHSSILVLAFIVLSEISSSSLTEIAGRIEQSQQRTRLFGALQAGLPLSRLVALLVCSLLSAESPTTWIISYTVSSSIYSGAIAFWLINRYHPKLPKKRDWSMASDGIPFMTGALSFRLQGEFNKPLLAQIDPAHAGNFSIAQRAVDFSSLPLTALQEVFLSRYFKNNGGIKEIWKSGTMILSLAFFFGTILTFSAPLLPRILGDGFESTKTILIGLAWLPTLQAIRNLANAAVISKNRHRDLTRIYIITGLLGTIANIALIASHELNGAIAAAYITESVSVILLFHNLLSRRTKDE